ncbi:MAG TPA: glycosyltransferase family 39 protein [Polyangiaceae bacterium]
MRFLARIRAQLDRWRHIADWALPAVVSLVFFTSLALNSHLRSAYELDPDEGNNLIKALLLDRGRNLYSEVWSDQPPFYSYLLLYTFRIFGWSVEVGRLLTAALVAALLYAGYDLVRRQFGGWTGHVAALLGALQLALNPVLVRHSMSAMIGLPSIVFAMLSLWVVAAAPPGRRLALLGSGALFALSLATKLFTAFLLPVAAGLAAWSAIRAGGDDRTRRAVRALGYWALGFGVTVLLTMLPVLLGNGFGQLLSSHLVGRELMGQDGRSVTQFLTSQRRLYAAAALGFVAALALRRPVFVGLGLWCGLGIVLLGRHAPVWLHHSLLISVPASLLSGFLIGVLVERASSYRGKRLLALAVASGLVLSLEVGELRRSLRKIDEVWFFKDSGSDWRVAEVIRAHAAHTNLMVTSRQIHAFRLRVEVPPWLAVTSSKRFKVGLLGPKEIIRIIRAEHPDIVVIDDRWIPWTGNKVQRSLRKKYRLVHEDPKHRGVRVYVRRGQPNETSQVVPLKIGAAPASNGKASASEARGQVLALRTSLTGTTP